MLQGYEGESTSIEKAAAVKINLLLILLSCQQRNDTTLPWGVTKTLISPTIGMAIRASSAVWRQDPVAILGLVLLCTSFHNVK